MIIKRDQEEIQSYLNDASNYKGNCSAVYFPSNLKEVRDAVLEAADQKLQVTISGNGTGLTGSRVPTGGIVLATEKLNKIIEINENELYAVVEPGVILKDLQTAVEEKNLFYPPDPTETNCFIGGTVAANASGAKTFKYGPTRNYVEELEIVLSDGSILELKRGSQKADGLNLSISDSVGKVYSLSLPDYKMPEVKNASGFYVKPGMDAIDLFIGSEGTLGVITKIKLKLLPLNKNIISCVVFFDDENDALNFIDKAREISYLNKNIPGKQEARALEYFDYYSLKFLSSGFPQIPESAKGAVWFEQEFEAGNEDALLEQWLEVILEFNGNEEAVWFASNENERARIHEFRHAISSKVNEYISHNNLRKLGTDVAVPDDKFREFYFYCKQIVEAEKFNYVAYGHFGNSHVHLNMLPENEERFLVGKEVYRAICRKAIELKGTISAEHGVGKIKTDYLVDMYGIDSVVKMGEIKKVFDPGLMFGIGNIIPERLLTKPAD